MQVIIGEEKMQAIRHWYEGGQESWGKKRQDRKQDRISEPCEVEGSDTSGAQKRFGRSSLQIG